MELYQEVKIFIYIKKITKLFMKKFQKLLIIYFLLLFIKIKLYFINSSEKFLLVMEVKIFRILINSFNDNNNYENSFNEMSILIILIKEVKMMILQMIYIKLFKFYFNVYNEIKKQ